MVSFVYWDSSWLYRNQYYPCCAKFLIPIHGLNDCVSVHKRFLLQTQYKIALYFRTSLYLYLSRSVVGWSSFARDDCDMVLVALFITNLKGNVLFTRFHQRKRFMYNWSEDTDSQRTIAEFFFEKQIVSDRSNFRNKWNRLFRIYYLSESEKISIKHDSAVSV